MSTSGEISDSDIVDGLSVRYLKMIGLWSSINFYRRTGRKNAVVRINYYIVLALCIPHVACQFVAYFMTRVDLQKATVLSIHAIGCLQICARYAILWTRLGAQCTIFDLLKKDFLGSIPEYKKPEVTKIYKRISARTNLLCTASLIANLCVITSYVIHPTFPVDYIQHGVGSMSVVSGGRKKVLGGWYPVQMSETPYYEIIYVYETLIKAWVGINLTMFASMFYQPLMCLYAHINALSLHIATLKADDSCGKSDNNYTQTNSKIYHELYTIIQEHQKLIRYTELLKNVYNPLVTMILAMGLLFLTFTIVQFSFGGVRNPMLSLKLLILCAFQVIEVIMFCLGSSSVEGASLDLSFAIYSSEWYRADMRYRRTAQMFMIRASKGMTLTAIKMYPVNKETMVAIFRFTYTASTLLSRMVE